ncbi:MAG: hypothetical protein JSS93_12760 [Bacteroidetes bacterium]|nr:hypothetical protein [Bacteroidota bacterium]
MNKITLSKRVPTQGAFAVCTSTIWGTCSFNAGGTDQEAQTMGALGHS